MSKLSTWLFLVLLCGCTTPPESTEKDFENAAPINFKWPLSGGEESFEAEFFLSDKGRYVSNCKVDYGINDLSSKTKELGRIRFNIDIQSRETSKMKASSDFDFWPRGGSDIIKINSRDFGLNTPIKIIVSEIRLSEVSEDDVQKLVLECRVGRRYTHNYR